MENKIISSVEEQEQINFNVDLEYGNLQFEHEHFKYGGTSGTNHKKIEFNRKQMQKYNHKLRFWLNALNERGGFDFYIHIIGNGNLMLKSKRHANHDHGFLIAASPLELLKIINQVYNSIDIYKMFGKGS